MQLGPRPGSSSFLAAGDTREASEVPVTNEMKPGMPQEVYRPTKVGM